MEISFTVLNKGDDAVNLVVTGINNIDSSVVSISIQLKGLY